MSIDSDRYNQFRDGMEGLSTGLSFKERIRRAEAKILDILFKVNPGPEEHARIERIIKNALDPELQPYVRHFVEKFKSTLDLVNRLYDDIGDDITRAAETVRAVEASSVGNFGKYRKTTIKSIRDAIVAGIRAEDSVDELTRRIQKVSVKAAVYARTIAQTQLKAAGQAAKLDKARLAEVEYFEYVGILRPTTRPFCQSHLGNTYHIDTINGLKNGNREPVRIFRGGWNCIHDWEPDPFANEEKKS